jgi:phosphomannomutase
MINNKIVLFDMDGTLTEPRGLFNTELLLDLRELSKYTEIGILTGSDFKYVESQLLRLLKFSEIRFNLHLLPCNGTKYYKPPVYSSDDFVLVSENNMAAELSDSCLKELFRILTNAQASVCYEQIPLTGHFIDYRGSMINWCPIGRNATPEQRKEFAVFDKEHNFRKRWMGNIKTKTCLRCPNKIDIKLGGETSFDIYPIGWDKTYGLKHFPDYECWFVGDRCFPGGNDYEIYDKLSADGRAFMTSGTIETGKIIREQIIPILKGEKNE